MKQTAEKLSSNPRFMLSLRLINTALGTLIALMVTSVWTKFSSLESDVSTIKTNLGLYAQAASQRDKSIDEIKERDNKLDDRIRDLERQKRSSLELLDPLPGAWKKGVAR